ncbi:MAG: hypothetical protein F7C34_04865 [Desulfurococcales archaeon]|nr:hypothetical protein [Desulfurococcales archaeon]
MDNKQKLVYAVLALVVVSAVAAGIVYYKPWCSADLVSCCLSTSKGVFRVNGSCSDLKIRIVDASGIVQAEVPVTGNLTLANLSLPSEGKYLVELVAGHRVLDKMVVETEKLPVITRVGAQAFWVNNTTLQVYIATSGEGTHSCFADMLGGYYIKGVLVQFYFANGSMKELSFPGEWPVGETIRLNITMPISAAKEILPNGMIVFVVDSLGVKHQATVFFQR